MQASSPPGSALPAVLFCLILLAGTGSGQEKPPALTGSLARSLARDILGIDDKKRDRAWEKLGEVAPEDLPRIVEELGKGFVLPPKPSGKQAKGSFMVEIPCEEVTGGLIKARIDLPRRYRHGASMPLVIRTHGAGMDGERLRPLWDRAGKVTERFIAVTPTFPFPEMTGTIQPWDLAVHATYDAVYRYMLAHYGIDTDRVFLSGYFMGAGFSFQTVQMKPHLFAGFHASGRLYWISADKEVAMAAARHVPGYFIIGQTDSPDRVDGHRDAARYYEKVEGYRGEFRIVPGEGAEQPFFSDYDEDALGFFVNRERVKFPKAFSTHWGLSPYLPTFRFTARCYFVEAQKTTGSTDCEVLVEGQTVAIKAPGLERAAVYLNDAIVDLDRPVIIKLNEKVVHEGKVERSLDFLRAQLELEKDAKLLYWNKVEIKR